MSVNADFFMVIDVLYGFRQADAAMRAIAHGNSWQKVGEKDVTDLIRHRRLADGGYTCVVQHRDLSTGFTRHDKASP